MQVPQQICEDFCRLTKTHLGAVLDKCGSQGPEVGPLLHVLQKTIEFEQELGDRFAEQVVVDESTGEVVETEVTELSDLYEELQGVDTTTTAGIRKKYELLRKIETQEGAANTTTASVSNTVTRPSTKFRGLISIVFEQYMSVYINAEERNMRQMIARAVSEEKWGVGDSFTKVLDSSAQLFLGIKKSLQRCVAINKVPKTYPLFECDGWLSQPRPLSDLHHQVFCACLQDYADALRSRVTESGISVAC